MRHGFLLCLGAQNLLRLVLLFWCLLGTMVARGDFAATLF